MSPVRGDENGDRRGKATGYSPWRRLVFMVGLVVAGEAVFGLPFHVARIFRPTVLDVFGFSNTQLGAAQAVYGVTAMLAYFPGGPLADRFPARSLLMASLLSTAAGGLYMATFPSHLGACVLHGYWGVTTILLFWAALIRATREWGGPDEQGRAYGILDAGRGLFAAAMASAAVVVFGFAFPADAATASQQDRLEALRLVILGYSAATVGAAVLVFFAVPRHQAEPAPTQRRRQPLAGLVAVLRMPLVWLQSLILICAYVGYKGIDNYSLFAVQAYGLSEVAAAGLVSMAAWARPVAAVGAGLLGDRLHSSRVVIGAFAILLSSHLIFALTTPEPSATWILIGNLLLACTAVFGLRGVYFALLQEAKVPMAVTGTAVGLVSVVGYTPDIFVNWVGGWLLDRTPGVGGHQHFFWFLASFAAIGLVAGVVFDRLRAGPDKSVASG